MRAIFRGKKSMGYKTGQVYVLASTTCRKGYYWLADINDIGKPTPYTSIDAILDNWEILSVPKRSVEDIVATNIKWIKENGLMSENNVPSISEWLDKKEKENSEKEHVKSLLSDPMKKAAIDLVDDSLEQMVDEILKFSPIEMNESSDIFTEEELLEIYVSYRNELQSAVDALDYVIDTVKDEDEEEIDEGEGDEISLISLLTEVFELLDEDTIKTIERWNK